MFKYFLLNLWRKLNVEKDVEIYEEE